jgi:Tfp pilus assembly protein PilF
MFSNSNHEKANETLRQGNIEDALLLFNKAVAETPNDPNIYSDRAVAFLHNKDHASCMADFDKAVNLQPDYAYRYASRAFAKTHFGDIEGAMIDYEKAIELDPNDAVAYNNLGMLLEQRGYKKEADERFERADKLSKQEDHLIQMMEDMETDESERKQEVPKAESAPVENPNSEIEEELGSTSQELKKVFTSRKQFREFINFVKNGFKIK